MLRATRVAVVLLVSSALVAPVADAQWVTVGRKVLGKVKEMTQVDERVVHLVIASVAAPGKPDETSIVASAALRICKEMGAECSLAKPD